MNHATEPTMTWTCFTCGNRREVPYKHIGAGVPACPTCRTAMEPEQAVRAEQPLIPGLAEALANIAVSHEDAI